MRATRKIVIGLMTLGAWLAPAATASGAPEPAWKLSMLALPTHLEPGTSGALGNAPGYQLLATNIGAGAATGPITLRATLPAGVTPIFGAETPVSVDSDPSSPDPTCAKTLGQTVVCSSPGPLRSSRNVSVWIPVEVSAGLEPGDVLPEATGSVESPGATAITTSAPAIVDTEPAPFGFLSGPAGLSTLFTEEDGSPSLLAGSHPNQLTIDVGFPIEQPGGKGLTTGAGHPRDIVTDLPPGVLINPNATAARCTEAQLQSGEGTECPDASQIGLVTVTTEAIGPRPATSALYNMVPPPGAAAMVAFNVASAGVYVHLSGGVRSESDFGLYAKSPDTLARGSTPVLTVRAQLWGDPTDASHDQVRGVCRLEAALKCPVDPSDTPLITMPSACSDTLTSEAHARSWEESEEGIEGLPHHTSAQATDVSGIPTGVSGCSLLDFDPSLTLRPDTDAAETPTGMEVEVKVPQSEGAEPATSNVRDVTVSFPKGMAVNPAAADGLAACFPAQIGLKTSVGETPPHFKETRPQCPDGSKIGTVEVSTPLLDHTVPGAVYVAAPFANPFGTLLGVYVVIDSPQDGIVVKLAGRTEADPETGQLTTSFDEAPQLPFSSFKVNLFGGPRAVLRTPSVCGTHTTRSVLAPWSGNPAVSTADSFQVSLGANGRPCVSSEAEMPHSPGFEAGTLTPLAAAFAPFAGRLTRDDGEQQLRGLNATLPPGLTGKLAGVETCSDAAIAAAAAKSGKEEQSNPSCPADSLIGQLTAGAGAGSSPFYTSGKIYLAGPYKGAPISGVAITPAVAGPFDLGTVVVRAPGRIDPVTTQLRIESDDFPSILEGIPLELRDARLSLNRPEFTLNPTSCDPMAISGNAISLLGAIAPLSQRFQVGGCRGLDYKPKLAIRLFGGTKRGAHPRLRAILTAKLGEANTARASVALPRSVFLDQSHIRTVCTRVQFAADQCPPGSIYGHAKAITPLLDETVEGPVYLRSSSNELPDMVAALKGPPSRPIEIELVGRIDSINGGIRSTFDFVPDQPVSKFILRMKGGSKGLVINSRDICKHVYRATAKFDGQNGKAHDFRPALRNDCKKKKNSKRARHRRARG